MSTWCASFDGALPSWKPRLVVLNADKRPLGFATASLEGARTRVSIELNPRYAGDLLEDLERSDGGYYVKPMVGKQRDGVYRILAIEISPLELDGFQELQRDVPRAPSRPASPLPARPDVNLQPIATALFGARP